MKTFNKKILGGAVSLLMAAAPGFANAAFTTFADFTIDENSVPGVVSDPSNVITADKFNGAYDEQVTIGTTLNANGTYSFETWAFATFKGLFSDEGVTPVDSWLGSKGAEGYYVEALFHATGQYDPVANLFNGQAASIDLFVDADKNTVVSAWGADASVTPTLANTGDDYSLGTASNPTRLVGIPGAPGAFDFIWDDFLLTPDGEKYFIKPRPFYVLANSNGDFDKSQFAPGTTRVTGDLSVVFGTVPEPSSLALLGLGFLGLSSFARRGKV